MVLTRSRLPVRASRLLLASSTAMLLTGAAVAQELDRATPALDLPPGEYPRTPIRLGNAEVFASADLRVEYDDNIYAVPDDKIDDIKFFIAPRLGFELSQGAFNVSGQAAAFVRRYVDNERENSTSGSIGTTASWQPTAADRLTAAADWSRLVEDRGDPEARRASTGGPRLVDVWRGDLTYGRQSQRIALMLRGSAARLDHVSKADANRNHDVYGVSGRLGYRLSGLTRTFGELFVSHRAYRFSATTPGGDGVDRDSTTYGGRVGISIDPGGKLKGDVGVGLFRLVPADDRLDERTGLSAQAALTYQPTRRLAFTLDAFSGDVATVRTGAQAREDTRIRLGVQQEAYHNLRWQGGLVYRRTKFIGTGIREKTLGGFGEIEYLVNRRLAVAAVSRISRRDSSVPAEEFERFRGALEFRVQY